MIIEQSWGWWTGGQYRQMFTYLSNREKTKTIMRKRFALINQWGLQQAEEFYLFTQTRRTVRLPLQTLQQLSSPQRATMSGCSPVILNKILLINVCFCRIMRHLHIVNRRHVTPPYYKQKQSKLCNMTPDFTTVGLPSRGDTNLYFLPQRKFALHTPLSSDEKKKWGFGVTVGKLPIKRWQRLKTVFPR